MTRGARIAVIGGGIGGLCAAWLLGRRHRVTLFERQARPGFIASSVTLAHGRGEVRVDVPLRVFYRGYYPTLVGLYRALGVATEPVSYAGSFMHPDGSVYFRYRNLRIAGRSFAYMLPRDFAGGRAAGIVAAMLRFRREAPADLSRGALGEASIGEYAVARGYGAGFIDGFLLPTIATVCTCPLAAARDFPAAVIVDYLARGLMRDGVRRACLGADDVARRLVAGIAEVRCNAAVAAVRRVADGVEVRTADGGRERFDHVVLASQANQSRALLADASAAESEFLAAFRYVPVEVVMHEDARLMPPDRRDWSPVNLLVDPAHDQPMSTIWINAVQPALRHARPLFQTVHPVRAPRAGTLIGQARFERPVVDAASAAAVRSLPGLHAETGRRVWFCGSYAQAGIPLLESAVGAAHAAVRALEACLARADTPGSATRPA
jgi:predicted NAD/FAD-binding protein